MGGGGVSNDHDTLTMPKNTGMYSDFAPLYNMLHQDA